MASLALFASCKQSDNGIRQVAENTVAIKDNGEVLEAGKYYSLTDNAKVFPTRATFEVLVNLEKTDKEKTVVAGIIQNVDVYAKFGGRSYVKQVYDLQNRAGIQEFLNEKSRKEAWTVKQTLVGTGSASTWRTVSSTSPKEIWIDSFVR